MSSAVEVHARPTSEDLTLCGRREGDLPWTIKVSEVTCTGCRLTVGRLLRQRERFIGPRQRSVRRPSCRFCVPPPVHDADAADFSCDRCGRDARSHGPPRLEGMIGGEQFLVCVSCNKAPLCKVHRRALRCSTWIPLREMTTDTGEPLSRVRRKFAAMTMDGAPIIHGRARNEHALCGSLDLPWTALVEWVTCPGCLERIGPLPDWIAIATGRAA